MTPEFIVTGMLALLFVGALTMIGLNGPGNAWREIGLAIVGGVIVGAALFVFQVFIEDDLQALQAEQRMARNADINATIEDASADEDMRVVLPGQDLAEFKLMESDLTNANLIESDLTNADLMESDLSEADLSSATLVEADLTQAVLVGADLTGADLSGADLAFADLSGADLRGANLDDVRLEGVTLTGATCPDGFVTETDCDGHLDTGR